MSEFRRRFIRGASSSSDIPAGCERLLCLISDTKQYIDTDFIPQAGDEVLIKSVKISRSTDYHAVISAGASDPQLIILITADASQTFFKYFSSGNAAALSDMFVSTYYDFSITSDGVLSARSYHGVQSVQQPPIAGTTLDTPLRIFKRANNSSSLRGSIGEISFTRNGDVVLHLIPVLDAAGEACYWDTVTRKYYRNNGTGAFAYEIL